MNSSETPTPEPLHNRSEEAAEHVADAQKLLKTLQERLEKHPELDEAVIKLELALSALTLETGGLL